MMYHLLNGRLLRFLQLKQQGIILTMYLNRRKEKMLKVRLEDRHV